MELLTQDKYKQINKLNKALESDVISAINAANAFVTRWLNFTSTPEFIEVNANRNKYFVSPSASSIETITELDSGAQVGSYHYLGDGTIYFSTVPKAGMYKVECNYTTFEGSVPDDLSMAVALYVDYLTKSDYRESRSFGGETVQFTTKTTGIPTHIRSILELFRNY